MHLLKKSKYPIRYKRESQRTACTEAEPTVLLERAWPWQVQIRPVRQRRVAESQDENGPFTDSSK